MTAVLGLDAQPAAPRRRDVGSRRSTRGRQRAGSRPAHRLDLSTLGTVLGVWAHPDDEVYLSGGLMRILVDAGHRVACLTATRGEHGSNDRVRLPADRMAAVRNAELVESLRVLGVDEHHQLDHADGSLDAVDPAVGVQQVRAVIDAVRPDTVITFGPDGFTGHPDHRAVSRWTAEALATTGGTPPRLLHVARTARWWVNGPGAWIDISMDPDDPTLPATTPSTQLAIDLDLDVDDTVLDRKVAALYAHASQVGWVIDVLGHDRFRRWVAHEQFVQS